ncbi:hypothetical protein PCASD_16859 [Puccinia coronata f. sp. avenae]|uniref:Uncharacterized protein n=1 Tax=Puccinia coronata f. sp. avenae TaxID=200324 RepID=A0A2N5SH66_9BASI|nr:hypothetical protein PCASD_16859 [Puccinia coronata f. sp. avenae]
MNPNLPVHSTSIREERPQAPARRLSAPRRVARTFHSSGFGPRRCPWGIPLLGDGFGSGCPEHSTAPTITPYIAGPVGERPGGDYSDFGRVRELAVFRGFCLRVWCSQLSSTMGIEAGSPAAASPWTPVSSPLRPSGSTE